MSHSAAPLSLGKENVNEMPEKNRELGGD